jgi:hypothetical protein
MMSADDDYIERIAEIMAEGKALHGAWSMQEVVDQLREEFGSNAARFARHYILKDICGIEDEEAYIDNNIKDARKQAMYLKLHGATDTVVEEPVAKGN